ncbi:MAG: DUF1844 domain-containing protein [Planctomycetota bacterium]
MTDKIENKKVDESWKSKIDEEKKKTAADSLKEPPVRELPLPDFIGFITTLAAQVMMTLGEIPNPVTNKKETDLFQAKYLIDLIGLLKEKTKGNLSEAEQQNLETILANLQIVYVKASGKK